MHQNHPATNTQRSKEDEKEVSNVDHVAKNIEMSYSEIQNETAQRIVELERTGG